MTGRADRASARKNALLKVGNKNDRIDARKIAELLRSGLLSPVYVSKLAIPCVGKLVYTPRHRAEWLQKVPEAGVRRRAERLYQQLDVLRFLRQDAKQELLSENTLGLQRAGLGDPDQETSCSSIALPDSLNRSDSSGATDRADSNTSSFPHQAATSAEYRFLDGQLQRSKKILATGGLNANHNRDLKNIFKGTATWPASQQVPFRNEIVDGSSHPGAQNRGDHFDCLEERSWF